ncbi:Hypothetical_protein [Hexamita inflata]|uniref:Hypothetical_protein n=1 Tax=Hexamita inflata TaxID=28002 RepID=A0AA86PES1_9EUKA|nr:Hypothetical protein HINF_LOCUS25595 [Hexamita inflata]
MHHQQRVKCKKFLKISLIIAIALLLSPLTVLALIITLLTIIVVVPLQHYQNRRLIQKYNADRISKFEKRTVQKDQNNNLTFLFKPSSNLNALVCIENGHLIVLNAQKTIMFQKKIKYSWAQGQVESFVYSVYQKRIWQGAVSETTFQVPPGHLIQTIICYNRLFFVILDLVFEVTEDLNVKLILQLPKFAKYHPGMQKMENQGGQMFSIDGKLYVHNCSTKLLEIKPDHNVKQIDKCKFNTSYYQFCDKVYAVNNQGIHIVQKDLSLVMIHEAYYPKIIFASSGTMVVLKYQNYNYCSEKTQIYYVISMIDSRVVTADYQNILFISIESMTEMGPIGLQLKQEILTNLFGTDASQRNVDYYNNYVRAQGLSASYSSNFYKLLFSSKLQNLIDSQVNNVYDKLDVLQEQYNNNKVSLSALMNSSANTINQLVSSYMGLFDQQLIQ